MLGAPSRRRVWGPKSNDPFKEEGRGHPTACLPSTFNTLILESRRRPAQRTCAPFACTHQHQQLARPRLISFSRGLFSRCFLAGVRASVWKPFGPLELLLNFTANLCLPPASTSEYTSRSRRAPSTLASPASAPHRIHLLIPTKVPRWSGEASNRSPGVRGLTKS